MPLGRLAQLLDQRLQTFRVFLLQALVNLLQPGCDVLRLGAAQLPPLPRHTTGQAQHAEQIATQHPQCHGALTTTRALEPGMLSLGIHGDDARQYFQQTLSRLGFPGQRLARRRYASLPGVASLPDQLPFDALRPEQRTTQGRADDAQADFRTAGDGFIEDHLGLANGGQGDDRDRVAGEHEGIRPGTAQHGRGSRAQSQPQGECRHEQQWCLGEQPHHHHGHEGSDQSAEQSRQPLLHHHAGQRLGDDERCHQRPLRLLQTETQRAPQRQTAAEQGLDGELNGLRARCKEHQQGITHDGYLNESQL